MRDNRTKIIATIGPASEKLSLLFRMAKAGMDVCRLNFSHGNHSSFETIIKRIRKVENDLGKPMGILQDLSGPKIRIGNLPYGAVELVPGKKVVLSVGTTESDEIPVLFAEFHRLVKKNDPVLLDDGNIELKVIAVDGSKIRARVEIGGILKSKKGINIPLAKFRTAPITNQDMRDIDFGVKHDVDFVAMSFVEHGRDIIKLRNILKQKKSKAKIIAKIERPLALKNLDGIVREADGIMVARGDLGIEIPAELVPLFQKKIIHLANRYGKPVIVATQMLASMVENPKPTRAEISDAANAIFDSADALMLSNETAVGKYPVRAVRILSRVASAVEKELAKHQNLTWTKPDRDPSLTNATCFSAAMLASRIRASAIIAITKTGYTAREIARYRPFTPIIAFTPDQKVARQLSIVWDILETEVGAIDIRNPIPVIKKSLIKKKLMKKGDEIVISNAGFSKDEKFLTTFRF